MFIISVNMGSLLFFCFAALSVNSVVSQYIGHYVSEERGVHVRGGVKLLSMVTEDQCMVACSNLPECLSVDFNWKSSECFGHTMDTHCGPVEDRHYVIHRKKIPCVRDMNRVNSGQEEDQGTCMAAAVYENSHSPGGTQFCDECTLEECLSSCNADYTCQAFDYKQEGGSCHHHDTRGACTYMTPLNGTNHVVKFRCQGDDNRLSMDAAGLLVSPDGIGFYNEAGVPLGGNGPTVMENPLTFMGLVYTGPRVSEIPSGWLLYPKRYILGGVRYNYPIPPSLDEAANMCIDACDRDPVCQSIDFNSADGTCFKHLSNTNCGFFGDADHIYHVKKDRCYYNTLYGTGAFTPIKFPEPAGIAP